MSTDEQAAWEFLDAGEGVFLTLDPDAQVSALARLLDVVRAAAAPKVPEGLEHEDVAFLQLCEVVDRDGVFDVAKAANELCDYRALLREVKAVYDQLGGYTEPTTPASKVIAAARLREEQDLDAAVNRETGYLRESAIAAAEALLSFKTGVPHFEAKKIYDGWQLDMDRLLRLRARKSFPDLIDRIEHARRGSGGVQASLLGQLVSLLKGEPRNPSLDGWV